MSGILILSYRLKEVINSFVIFSALYLCIAKQSFILSCLVLKTHVVLNISDVVL